MAIPDPLSFDGPLTKVFGEIRRLDPDGVRTARVIRNTFDQLYDGGRTGRYRWEQLFKTEKTHFGTLIEINLQREFEFPDGQLLDFCIAEHEVDAKYSQKLWGWMLPPEAVGQLCMVITANDEKSVFSLGIVRATLDVLTEGSNRDAKRTLSKHGHDAVVWVHRDAEFPPNVLLHLPDDDLAAVLAQKAGQPRVNELFRRAVGRRVTRSTVETVAMQRDPLKRVRGNGGARQHLASEGIAIFGGYRLWQRDAAGQLGLPVPESGEFVSCYLREVEPDEATNRSVEVHGSLWIVAEPDAATPIPSVFYDDDSKRPQSYP